MSDFIQLVQTNGLLGLFVGSVVLIAVYAMSKGKVVVTKGQKQAANVILSILLAGVSLVNPQREDVLVAGIASIASALVYELIHNYAKEQAKKSKAKAIDAR